MIPERHEVSRLERALTLIVGFFLLIIALELTFSFTGMLIIHLVTGE